MADRVTQVVRQVIAENPPIIDDRITQVVRQVIVENTTAPSGLRRRYAAVIG